MSQKPFNLPRFATTTGQVLEPSEAEKDAGWPRDFKVPADWWNWINRQAYQWLRYLAGVPAGNIIFRNPGSAALSFGSGSTDNRIYMLRVFEGAGDLKEIGGTERHDEWWIGQWIQNTVPRMLRFPKGIGGGSHEPTTPAAMPRHIYRDPGTGDYASIGNVGAATVGSTTASRSTDGETWVAPTTTIAFTTAPAAYADNGLAVGAGSVIMMVNGAESVFTSTDMGDNWITAHTGGSMATDMAQVYDMAYSPVSDTWCVVGNPEAGETGIMTSIDDGATWVPVTGIPTTAGRHFTSVVALDDGNFLAAGGTASGAGVAGVGIMAISSAATVFADVAVIPNVHRFARLAKQGARVLAVAQQESDNDSGAADHWTQVMTFDSFSEGASGSWKVSGIITQAPPFLNASGALDPFVKQMPEYGDLTLGVVAGSVPQLVMTAEETLFTVLYAFDDTEPNNMIVGELAHPTVGF